MVRTDYQTYLAVLSEHNDLSDRLGWNRGVYIDEETWADCASAWCGETIKCLQWDITAMRKALLSQRDAASAAERPDIPAGITDHW